MAKFLAIDWDETECRYVAAALQHDRITVREAGVVSLVSTDNNEADSLLYTLATSIYAHCKEEQIGSCPLLISLGRNEVEWLQQKLPPCTHSEIPLLLRNQVLREISGSTEADPIDYIVLETSKEGHRILALLMTQAYRKSLQRTFRSLGFPPARIGIRAGNAAELVLRNQDLLDGAPESPRLIVNAVGHDVDLIILSEGCIAAIRSFRLPTEESQKNLADEIERTLTIGLDRAEPLSIQHVVLFGDGAATELPQLLSRSGLTVQCLDPFSLPHVSIPKDKRVREPEKFAPILGSLLVQSQRFQPAVDFLHPKEAPKPPNYTRPVLLVFVLFCIVCFGLYYWNQGVLRDMESELSEIKERHHQVSGDLQHVMPAWNVVRHTVHWESQNVVWLDVLRDLSSVLPSSTDLVVTQMSMSHNTNPRFSGTISLSGMVRDPSVQQKLQRDLQSSGRYMVQHPQLNPNPAGGGYPWLFRTTIYRLR